MIRILIADVLWIYGLVLLARVVLDWTALLVTASAGPVRAKAVMVTHGLTEPLLRPLRRVLPPVPLGRVRIDLAFIALFVLIELARLVVLGL